MSSSGTNAEITRIDTSLGVVIVVSHGAGVRVGLAASQGGSEWYAQCVDWYSPSIPPIPSRVPEKGGLPSLDDLEQAMAREVTAQLQTDYWRDR